jgi:hypothetical protein
MAIDMYTFLIEVANKASWSVDTAKLNCYELYWNIHDQRQVEAIKHLRNCISQHHELTAPGIHMTDQLFAAIMAAKQAHFMHESIGLRNAKNLADYLRENLANFNQP